MTTPTITNASFEDGYRLAFKRVGSNSLGAAVYMECQKNHAIEIGGMAMICCACNCHRNFHRKVPIQVQAADEVECYRRKDKKRMRTKFSEEQKEKMLEFALKSDWKMQKIDETKVKLIFCEEIGIKKKVLNVWMHNNKSKCAKKSTPTPTPCNDN